MSALLILASLAGFIALENKSKKKTIGTSSIKINNDCTKFINPVELTKTGFGYDNRSLGLSGLFLLQHSWNKTKEQIILDQYQTLEIKNFESLLSLIDKTLLKLFFGICDSDQSENHANSASLKDYLSIDLLLTCTFTLYINTIRTGSGFNDSDILKCFNFIDEKFKVGKYVYSSEDIKLVSTRNEQIQQYYKNIFRILPEYKNIPTKILAKNELIRSSIKYVKEDNTYKFYNYPDTEITKLNWLIAKAKA